MKYKAESGGRSNPATHTPTGDPSLDAVFSSLSIKTSSNQPSTVNSHIWKGRFFLVATCRQLGSAAAVPALTFRSVILDIQSHSHFFALWPWQIATPLHAPLLTGP